MTYPEILGCAFIALVLLVIYITFFLRWEAEERREIEGWYKEICAQREAEREKEQCMSKEDRVY
jgi:hypothetical protein